MQRYVVSALATLTLTGWAAANEVTVDWLYFSPSGSWLSRADVLTDSENRVQLPVAALDQNSFWWHASDPNTQVWWPSAEHRFQPKIGSEVSADTLNGRWFISEVNGDVMVLSQGVNYRYWPKNQWHLLNIRQPNQLDSLALTVKQPLVQESDFDYAWRDNNVSATIQYQLVKSDNDWQLRQELVVMNRAQYAVDAPGYSFAAANQAPVFPMMSRAMAADSLEMAAPQASESEGISTLISQQPISIPAQTQVWLPVRVVNIGAVQRGYNLNWDSRQQGVSVAQSEWLLNSTDDLPEIPGPVTVAVFDQQIASLSSYYSADQARNVRLDMGTSNLVTLTTSQVSSNRWELLVSNRSDQAGDVTVTLNHWDGQRNQRVPVTFAMAANSNRSFKVTLDSQGQITVES